MVSRFGIRVIRVRVRVEVGFRLAIGFSKVLASCRVRARFMFSIRVMSRMITGFSIKISILVRVRTNYHTEQTIRDRVRVIINVKV